MTTAVHQLLPVFSYGDAIGAATLKTQDMLHALGYRSDTFAEVIDARLQSRARPATELLASLQDGDAVLYRLSIGSPLASLVERSGARRVVVYHNITPAQYFGGTNPRVTYWLERGRGDLRRLAPIADLVIGDSTYNLDEAVAAGARRTAVIAPPVDLARLSPRTSRPGSPPTILFVGRVAPNKRHDTLVRALVALRATAIPDARLALVGSADDTSAYLTRLQDLVERLGVADAVFLEDERVTDVRLGEHYARAAVFATASEHEGYCVPLVEAMAFEVPIVAFAAGAVPETAAGAALLLDNRDPLVWAGALERAIRDTTLRSGLIAAGRSRVREVEDSAIQSRLGDALRSAGIVP